MPYYSFFFQSIAYFFIIIYFSSLSLFRGVCLFFFVIFISLSRSFAGLKTNRTNISYTIVTEKNAGNNILYIYRCSIGGCAPHNMYIPIATFSCPSPGTDVEQPDHGGDVHYVALVGARPHDARGAAATHALAQACASRHHCLQQGRASFLATHDEAGGDPVYRTGSRAKETKNLEGRNWGSG